MESGLLIRLFIASLVHAVAVAVSFTNNRVPVLMWTSDEMVTFPRVLAGHTLQTESFNQQYVAPLLNRKNQNIVVFVQDKLSVADISHFANVYGYEDDEDEQQMKNLKSIMSELQSTQIPNVISPLTALQGLKDAGMKVQVLKEPFNFEMLNTDVTEEGDVFIVELPSAQHSDDGSKMFQKIDEVVGSVNRMLKRALRPYVAVYTALTSSRVRTSEEESNARTGMHRHLLVDEKVSAAGGGNASKFFNESDSEGGKVFLFIGGVSVDGVALDLCCGKLQLQSPVYCMNYTGDASNASCVLNLTYSDNADSKFSFVLDYKTSDSSDPGYYYLSTFTLSYINASSFIVESLDTAPLSLYTPRGSSYSCYSPAALTAKGSSKSVTFNQFQIQLFVSPDAAQFGPYNDCESFFSLPIWMGLISLLVFISIIVFGICMLYSVTTMDRFDDPKGKTIIVATTAD